MMDLSRLRITAERSRSLRQHLQDLVEEAGLTASAVLLDSGAVIASYTVEGEWPHLDELGALATGAFFSSREMAKRLGEPDFTGLHYEGRHGHFFISPIRSEFILLCVFGNETKIGIVRSCSHRHTKTLGQELRLAHQESDETAVLPASGMGLSSARW